MITEDERYRRHIGKHEILIYITNEEGQKRCVTEERIVYLTNKRKYIQYRNSKREVALNKQKRFICYVNAGFQADNKPRSIASRLPQLPPPISKTVSP